MAYTSHGHHIPGTVKGRGSLADVKRCGGVDNCPRCKSEVENTMALVHGESKDYQVRAKTIAAHHIRERLQAYADFNGELPVYDVYLVWFAKVLLNWKALAASTMDDGLYYELTHDGDKGLTYIDTYQKIDNTVVRD